MDLAEMIFRVGVGAGALLIGLALLLLVISLRGLGRDARQLAMDLERLNRLLARVTDVDVAGAAPSDDRAGHEPAAPAEAVTPPAVGAAVTPEQPSEPARPPDAPTVNDPASPYPQFTLPETGWRPPAEADRDDATVPPEEEVIGWWPGGASDGPVQSADEREDERIA